MSDRTPLIRVTAMPSDTNPYGGVFGGWLMGQMGLACGSFASRHSGGKATSSARRTVCPSAERNRGAKASMMG